jgi:phosphopantetheinyl transferase (holo-ACP synthase)
MISTGNDIVSLNAINVARTKQHRFYSKIISGSERSLYDKPGFEAMPFENFIWLLWSIKESAYKFLQRIKPDLVFTPIKFEIKQLNVPLEFKILDFDSEADGTGFDDLLALPGIIAVGADKLYSRSLMYKQAIMTVVNGDENFNNTYWGIKIIENADHDTQSLAVREFLLNRLKKALDISDLAIIKNARGVPVLLSGANDMAVPVSLSHHETIIAYSFPLDNC